MQVTGNKMDSKNLATVLGPNFLHRNRAASEKQILADCTEHTAHVISVVRDLIDHHMDLFQVTIITLSVCLSFYLSLSVSVSVIASVCLSPCVCVCVCVCGMCVCVCVYV